MCGTPNAQLYTCDSITSAKLGALHALIENTCDMWKETFFNGQINITDSLPLPTALPYMLHFGKAPAIVPVDILVLAPRFNKLHL